ncbi:MAG: ABC-F family ATP-binding cassette domain-containing protein, partial [Anaerolineae bacterium]|nr:ABC-F family ATP-binding cassette domain-containing protein [Anaerolineae bacterium]
MSILTAINLSKSFGIQDVFWGVNVSVAHGERIALVGPNGVGKTTLLRILVGLEAPGEGAVMRMNNARIGYLAQDAIQTGGEVETDERNPLDERTPLDLCLNVFVELQEMQSRLRQLEAQLADPEQSESAMERYGKLLEQFEHAGGYEYTVEIDTVLSGLGIDQMHRRRPVGQLSGGQRTRAVLAKLLLEKPHILVLDEPTNHLDMQAIEWLESYLQTWPGALLAVSHDRYFMDHV